jgi:quercetin dioxygenase-like cupin family protein
MTNTSPGAGRREQLMASSRRTLVAALLMTSALIHPSTLMAQETITPLISNDLGDVSGKESLLYTVEFPPGFSSPVHRHNAHVSLYVLEGSVVMQVKGGKEITLTPGQSFSEVPGDVHVVSRNASSTRPARFLVFMVKDKGAPLVVLEK